MITEDYVSFEIAKLLKKKGFDEKCEFFHKDPHSWIYQFKNGIPKSYSDNPIEPCFLAPTLQMAMKWLREVHNIYIDISPTYSEVEKTIHFIWQIFDSNYDGVGDCEIFYDKYETACEESIKYCLEHLI